MKQQTRIKGTITAIFVSITVTLSAHTSASPLLMMGALEIYGTVEAVDSIKGIVTVGGKAYRYAPQLKVYKADGVIGSSKTIRIRKGMKVAIKHAVEPGKKTLIAQEIWVQDDVKQIR